MGISKPRFGLTCHVERALQGDDVIAKKKEGNAVGACGVLKVGFFAKQGLPRATVRRGGKGSRGSKVV